MSLVVEVAEHAVVGAGLRGGGRAAAGPLSVHPVDCLASLRRRWRHGRPADKTRRFFDQRRSESLYTGLVTDGRRRPVPTGGARDLAAMAEGRPRRLEIRTDET